jgi:PAS domain S-box-containing protein
MLNSIKHWFASPVFEGDEEKTHRASLLNLYTIIFTLFAIIVMVGSLLGGRTPTRALVINALVILFGLALHYWLYQGNIKVVGIGAISLTFIGATAAIASMGTIRAPITASYIFVVILVGVLYDWRGILASALICSLAVLGLMLAEDAGILPQPDYTVTITQWVTYTALFVFIASLVYSNNQITRKALTRAEQEIAERRHVEMELRKLSLAVEQSPASIVITDLDGKIEYVNRRFTQVTGYSFEESIGKNPHILKTLMTPPETHRQLWENNLTGQEWRGEFVNRKKDDSIYYESAVISPVFDEAGRPSHYLAIKEDITQSRKTASDLRASEARFRALFNQNHDGVFIIGLDGKTKDANQRAAEMLGYSIEELREGKDRESIAAPESPATIHSPAYWQASTFLSLSVCFAKKTAVPSRLKSTLNWCVTKMEQRFMCKALYVTSQNANR